MHTAYLSGWPYMVLIINSDSESYLSTQMVKVSTKLWEGAYFSPSLSSTLVLKCYRQADHNVANQNCIVSWLSNCLWLVNCITCEPVNRRQLSSLQQSVVAQTLIETLIIMCESSVRRFQQREGPRVYRGCFQQWEGALLLQWKLPQT